MASAERVLTQTLTRPAGDKAPPGVVFLPSRWAGSWDAFSSKALKATDLQKGRKNPRQFQLVCSANGIPEGLTK